MRATSVVLGTHFVDTWREGGREGERGEGGRERGGRGMERGREGNGRVKIEEEIKQ